MLGLKRKTWIIGGVVAALTATGAIAAKNHFTPEKRMAYMSDRVSDSLNLNVTQKESFEKVATSFLQVRGGSADFMLTLSGQLKDLAADKTLTVEEVNTLRDQIKAEFDRRSEIVIPEFVAFYNSLDDDQKGQILDKIDKIESRVEGHHKGYGKHRFWGNH
ncbi:MAG: hypothetical protein COC00_011590 [Rhizobiales bacterium]|nr:hypothetical protein [Hyphomicrobiales bacterium]